MKDKEYCKSYYAKNKEKILAKQKLYQQENKGIISSRTKVYREKNKEKIAARNMAKKAYTSSCISSKTNINEIQDGYQLNKINIKYYR